MPRFVTCCNPQIQTLQGWTYYERREDGSLDELLENDNPFHHSVWQLVPPSTNTMTDAYDGLYAALGDWNGDGALDLVAMDAKRVSCWQFQNIFWNGEPV